MANLEVPILHSGKIQKLFRRLIICTLSVMVIVQFNSNMAKRYSEQ